MSSPTYKPPLLFPLRIETSVSGIVIHTPRRLYVFRGLLAILALPPLLLVLALLLFGDVEGDVGLIVWGVLAGASVTLGVALIALQGVLSARTRTIFDRTTLQIFHPRWPSSIDVRQVAAVRARSAGGLGFCLLELVAPNGETRVLHARLPAGRALLHVTEMLAATLGVAAQCPAEMRTHDPFAGSANTAAALCYLPFEGIFLLASLWYLATEKERPLVRFACRQSLLQQALFIVLLLPLIAALIVSVLLIDDGSPARIVVAIVFGVGLIALAFWNIGARILACVRASRGQAWVMPWLRPLVRNWKDYDRIRA